MPLSVRAAGATKNVVAAFVRAGGSVKAVRNMWIRADGQTKLCFSTFSVSFSPDPISFTSTSSSSPPYTPFVYVSVIVTNGIGASSVVSITRRSGNSQQIFGSVSGTLQLVFSASTNAFIFSFTDIFDVVVQDSGGNSGTYTLTANFEGEP